MLEQSLPILERYVYLPSHPDEYYIPLHFITNGSYFSGEAAAIRVPQVLAVYTPVTGSAEKTVVKGKTQLVWKYEYGGVCIR